jgi:hypothetical protein
MEVGRAENRTDLPRVCISGTGCFRASVRSGKYVKRDLTLPLEIFEFAITACHSFVAPVSPLRFILAQVRCSSLGLKVPALGFMV